ncbi:MAG TPA: peptide ABC transporter substrate-binding protein [Ktedonobacteraceae bacterium]|jgi:peptide/nickel transport system substrate-binding protein/oligopeptide transport system substrate-binding protein
MQSRKKFVFGFLPLLMSALVLALAACGSSGAATPSQTSSKAPENKQIMRYPVVGDIATFDPALVQDTDSNFPIQAVFTGLVSLNDQLAVQPQLAQSWKVSPDGLTYTFTLKPNLKFSDGTPLTSQDVIYSINRTILPATKSPVSYYLSQIKDFDKASAGKIPTLIGDSLQAPDPNTVVITISQPGAYFLQALTYPTSYVVNQKLINKYGTSWTDHEAEGAGDGPFKVQSYSHTTGIQLVRNDNYYGKQSQIAQLSIPFYTDQDGMYKAYQAKQIDYTPVPPAEIDNAKNMAGYQNVSLLVIRYLSMNYLSKPFDNIKIRQAFALAVNKDIIVQTAMHGAFTATNHIIPQGMPGYDTTLTGPDGVASTAGNPTMAKQLLQEGMKEEGITKLPPITLTYYPRNQQFKDALTAVTQMWSTVLGATVKVNIVARAQLLTLENATTNNAKGLQIWQAGWAADYPDPQDWLSTFFQKGSDYNQFNYGQNPTSAATEQQAVQKTLAQADMTNDNTQRMKLYNDAEQKIINDVGWLPLWQENQQTLVRPTVHGMILNAQLIIPPDDWGNIYITQ